MNMQYSADFLNYQSNVNEDGSFKRAGLKVLVIEDDKIIQLVHREFLLRLDCQVTVVSSGEEALSLIEERYDLILLDIGLPGISGVTVAEKFRGHEQHKKTKIIAITAHSDAITNNLYCSGIEKVLNKPLNMEDLKQIIFN